MRVDLALAGTGDAAMALKKFDKGYEFGLVIGIGHVLGLTEAVKFPLSIDESVYGVPIGGLLCDRVFDQSEQREDVVVLVNGIPVRRGGQPVTDGL